MIIPSGWDFDAKCPALRPDALPVLLVDPAAGLVKDERLSLWVKKGRDRKRLKQVIVIAVRVIVGVSHRVGDYCA